MTVRALVIDDDPAIVEELVETLASLGHECETAGCMATARAALEGGRFDYILLDLEIPVGESGKFPRIDNGKNLLREIRNAPGTARTPVIVMTGYGNDGPYQAVEVLRLGAVHYVPKPFGLGESPSLDEAIRAAVPQLEKPEEGDEHSTVPLEPFRGGELVFSEASVALEGVAIAGPKRASYARRVLDHLNQPSQAGARRTWRSFSGAAIASEIGATDENAVSSAVKKLRAKISKQLASEIFVEVGPQDVIENQGQGYRLADRITVAGSSSRADDPVKSAHDSVNDPENEHDDPAHDPAGRRRAWVMVELKRGRPLRGPDLMSKFEVSASTAKRDLQALSKDGLIEFVGAKKTGHYQVKSRPG